MKHAPDPSTYTRKLDPAVKAVWTTALRSGNYQQCVACLDDDEGGHCALGVLLAATGARMTYRPLNEIMTYELQTAIEQLNDSERKSFHEIADWIEEHL
jgi:hypothetical protein